MKEYKFINTINSRYFEDKLNNAIKEGWETFSSDYKIHKEVGDVFYSILLVRTVK